MIKSVLFTSCSDLPLDRFLSIMYDQSAANLKFLIKKEGLRKTSEKTLKETWDSIYEEYTEMNSSEGNTAFFQLLKQKTILQNKIAIAQCCIDGLSSGYSLELVNVLKKMGYNFKFSKETYKKDLIKVVAKSKPWVLQLQKLNKSIAPYLEGEQLKMSDFDDILVTLSKFQGYRITKESVTVSEFVKILNNYKKWQTPKKSPK